MLDASLLKVPWIHSEVLRNKIYMVWYNHTDTNTIASIMHAIIMLARKEYCAALGFLQKYDVANVYLINIPQSGILNIKN